MKLVSIFMFIFAIFHTIGLTYDLLLGDMWELQMLYLIELFLCVTGANYFANWLRHDNSRTRKDLVIAYIYMIFERFFVSITIIFYNSKLYDRIEKETRQLAKEMGN